MELIKSSFIKNFSFLVLLMSSLLFFITNIILKKNMDSLNYGDYALLLTLVSISSSLGFFGAEQLVLRYSYVKENILYINSQILINLGASLFIFCIIFLLFGQFYLPANSLLQLVLFLNVIFLMLFYNIYRLLKKFTLSQLLYNSWKYFLFLYILYKINKLIVFFDIFYFLMVSTFIAVIISAALFFKNYKIQFYIKKNENITMMQINFFISMLIVTFLSFGDRLLVEYYIDTSSVGIYFYYVTVVLFPYVLFQSYFGFKELTSFRENFSISILNKKIFNVIIFSFLLSSVIGIFLLILNNLNFDSFRDIKLNNYILIGILMLTGVLKIIYSILSAAVGATVNTKRVKTLNYYNIAITSLIVFYFFIFVKIVTIELIAILYLLLWLSRVIIYYFKGINHA